MKKSLTIIGAGAWGSALAIVLSDKFDHIFLIAKNQNSIEKIGIQHHALSKPFSNNISLGCNYGVIDKSEAILIATPSYAFSSVLSSIKSHLNKKPIAWVTKGFDPNNGNLLHETFTQKLPGYYPCIISGPTFAAEIVEKKPAAIVVAS
jgi:glycerol-3-phosphate dehydrogenase (NAD(P)+)